MTILHDREVATRFDALAGRFKADVDRSDYRLKAVVDALAGLGSPRVLDLGCGKGRFAREFERLGATVVGVDLSMLMLAEGRGLSRIRATARRLPFDDGCFDAVVAVEAIEHVGEVDVVLDEARRVLRPGGRLVILDKNRWSLDPNRPWLPALLVKAIDERRGRWMYPSGGPVKERWFGPRSLGMRLARRFGSVEVDHPISPEESRWSVFRGVPRTRRMTRWTAIAPGGEN